MKSYGTRKSGYAFPLGFSFAGGIAALCFLWLSSPITAKAAALAGESKTILRTQRSVGDRNLYPLYEYLRLGGAHDVGDKGALTYSAGGWGRIDLRDKTTESNPFGSLQYGKFGYAGKTGNFLVDAGRQFVAEGVAAERIDGVYTRGDLPAGFGASAFVGAPVVLESNFEGGDLIYGARLSQSHGKYYSVGLSALRTDDDSDRIREEAGIDIWLNPVKQVDIWGRSSYNSITSGWMEHDYTVTVTPLEKLRFTAEASQIKYRDYFYQVTTSALSLTNGLLDPNEEVVTLAARVDYSLSDNIRIAVNYKNFEYDIAGNAKYFGGRAVYSLPDSLAAGLSYHRMDGEIERLKYHEYRVFAQKKIGKADITADFFDVNYDGPINGVKNTYSVSLALGYDLTEKLRAAADIAYSKTTDFDRQVAGFFKLIYTFDLQFGAEGRAKGEK